MLPIHELVKRSNNSRTTHTLHQMLNEKFKTDPQFEREFKLWLLIVDRKK